LKKKRNNEIGGEKKRDTSFAGTQNPEDLPVRKTDNDEPERGLVRRTHARVSEEWENSQ